MSTDDHVLAMRAGEEDASELLAPSVGIFKAAVEKGQWVSPGQLLGTIEVLGVQHRLLAPNGLTGRVSRHRAEGVSRVPVQYGDSLFTVVAESLVGATAPQPDRPPEQEGALSFVAPMSGRFYSRPSPNEPPFVEQGETIRKGQTVGLLEVMKTFNRLVYGGDALPEQALVERFVPEDGDDVARGDVLLVLAPTTER
ncbi:MAG: hypothetical protein PVH21_10100 [Myxococcales bacterium]|jgi:acetyl-CoA carboxylase biotin carboxyl carrier protein